MRARVRVVRTQCLCLRRQAAAVANVSSCGRDGRSVAMCRVCVECVCAGVVGTCRTFCVCECARVDENVDTLFCAGSVRQGGKRTDGDGDDAKRL